MNHNAPYIGGYYFITVKLAIVQVNFLRSVLLLHIECDQIIAVRKISAIWPEGGDGWSVLRLLGGLGTPWVAVWESIR